jgi:hypothetical protein
MWRSAISCLYAAVGLVALVMSISTVTGYAAEGQDEAARAEETLRDVTEIAETFDVVIAENTIAKPLIGRELVLKKEPLLRWSNPEVGSIHGAVFLWTLDDRPIASIFRWYEPRNQFNLELHSLSEQPLVGRREGQVIWSTNGNGVVFEPWPGAPAPAANPAQRLVQMRSLLREIQISETERDNNQVELRLLNQPLHRYRHPDSKITDGGAFTFVRATDPEVIVLLEARTQADGQSVWEYAFARMNSIRFEARRGGNVIWKTETLDWPTVFHGRELYNVLDWPSEKTASRKTR